MLYWLTYILDVATKAGSATDMKNKVFEILHKNTKQKLFQEYICTGKIMDPLWNNLFGENLQCGDVGR